MDRKFSVKKLILAISVIVGMVAAVTVHAQGPPPAAGQEGPKLDQTPMFNEIDADGNGKATAAEWKTAGAPDMIFQMVDSNKDNEVTAEELNTSSPPAAVDKDEDGKVTLSEVKEFMSSMTGRQGGPPQGGTPPGEVPVGGFVANSPHVGDGPTGQDFIDVLDSDGDGKVTHQEWEMNKRNTVYKNKRWPNYNQNRDEYITLDEAPQPGVNWEPAPTD